MDNKMNDSEFAKAQDAALRDELLSLLPNPEEIEVIKLLSLLPNPEEIEGIKCKTGIDSALHAWQSHFPEAKAPGYCIAYRAKYVRGSEQLDQRTKAVFAASYHPFIGRFSCDPVRCAEKMAQFFPYRPFYYELFRGNLFVSFASGYHNCGFLETQEYVGYEEWYTESSHDGGGSGSNTWRLWPAKVEIGANELFQDNVANHVSLPSYRHGIHFPECKGYWFKGEHLYVVDPWDIPGVFEFFMAESYERDWASETEHWSIGIRP